MQREEYRTLKGFTNPLSRLSTERVKEIVAEAINKSVIFAIIKLHHAVYVLSV